MDVPIGDIEIHRNCFSYNNFVDSKNQGDSLVKVKHFEKGSTHRIVAKSNMIVAVLKGSLRFSFGQTLDREATDGSIIMHPIDYGCVVEIEEDTTVIIFYLNIDLNFCDHFSFDMLYKEEQKKKGKQTEIHTLKANDIITTYLTNLNAFLNDKFYCSYFLEIKLKEFLYLLRYYNSLQELKAFFRPILSNDFSFFTLVMRNYDPALTAEDLAKTAEKHIKNVKIGKPDKHRKYTIMCGSFTNFS